MTVCRLFSSQDILSVNLCVQITSDRLYLLFLSDISQLQEPEEKLNSK